MWQTRSRDSGREGEDGEEGAARKARPGAGDLRRGVSVRARAPRLFAGRGLCAGGRARFPPAGREPASRLLRAGSDVIGAFPYYPHREKLRLIGREGALEPMNRQALAIAK